MRKSLVYHLLLLLIATTCSSTSAMSRSSLEPISIDVNSSKELEDALLKAKSGTLIILNDGKYGGSDFVISKNGTPDQPIVIKARNRGKVFLESALKIDGSYISLQGIHFIENGKLEISGKGCRITYCTWDDAKPGIWLHVLPGSSEIEIAHNTFQNKVFSNQNLERTSQLLRVVVRNKNERHHIHHNLFKNVAKGKTSNGYETLQLITENNPFNPPPGSSNSIIKDNLFLRCNGEDEIISVKSNGNILRRNTFRESRGGLVLRHGHNNVVTQNYFIGRGERQSFGVRIQGTGQVVANNYFQDLGSYALGMMDGTPDDLYVSVEQAQILYNTFINCNNTFRIGINHSLHPNGTVPKDCKIIGNIFFFDSGDESRNFIEFVQNDEPENWVWKDNIGYGGENPSISGFQLLNPEFERSDNGLMVPTINTKSSVIVIDLNEEFKIDLFGNKWNALRTVGAIQFPFETTKNPPLSESSLAFAPHQEILQSQAALPAMDIFLAFGQSNMAGRAPIEPSVAGTLNNVKLLADNNNWVDASNPMNLYSTVRKEALMQQVGPSWSFAKSMARHAGKLIGMVVNARGGTTIEDFSAGGPYYEANIARIAEAKTLGTIKGIIWHQGESNNSDSQYLTKLNAMLADYRAVIGDTVFFLAGQLGNWNPEGGQTPKYNSFNTMIPGILTVVDNSDYVLNTDLTHIGDHTHFNLPSQILLGQRYAQKMLAELYGIDIFIININLMGDGFIMITGEEESISPANDFSYTFETGSAVQLSIEAGKGKIFTSLVINGTEISSAKGQKSYIHTFTAIEDITVNIVMEI